MIRLTEELRQLIDTALASGTPGILATASRDGQPGVGFKGSMMVFDDDHLAYWERTRRGQLAHLLENPRVVVMFRDGGRRIGWKFFGVATVHKEGPVRERVLARTVAAELDRDPERQGYAVLIRVDRVTTTGGQVLQEREGVEVADA